MGQPFISLNPGGFVDPVNGPTHRTGEPPTPSLFIAGIDLVDGGIGPGAQWQMPTAEMQNVVNVGWGWFEGTLDLTIHVIPSLHNDDGSATIVPASAFDVPVSFDMAGLIRGQNRTQGDTAFPISKVYETDLFSMGTYDVLIIFITVGGVHYQVREVYVKFRITLEVQRYGFGTNHLAVPGVAGSGDANLYWCSIKLLIEPIAYLRTDGTGIIPGGYPANPDTACGINPCQTMTSLWAGLDYTTEHLMTILDTIGGGDYDDLTIHALIPAGTYSTTTLPAAALTVTGYDDLPS